MDCFLYDRDLHHEGVWFLRHFSIMKGVSVMTGFCIRATLAFNGLNTHLKRSNGTNLKLPSWQLHNYMFKFENKNTRLRW